jgi:hypothetical protein
MKIFVYKPYILTSFKGGTMLPGKLLITGVLATLVIGGCVQKKPQSRKNTTQSTKTVSKPILKDTTDIFDEFYKDEASSSRSAAEKGGNETFSTVSSSKRAMSAPSGQFSENGRYILQVSTIKSKNFADKVASKLEAMGFPSYVTEVQDPTPALSGAYYRVRIGGFASISSARSFGETTLKDAGYDFWIDNRSNDNVGASGSGMGSSGAGYSSPSGAYTGSNSNSASNDYSASENSTQYTPAPSAVQPTTPPAVKPAASASTPAATANTGSVPDTSGWDSAW